MEVKKQPKLKFNGVDIINVSFNLHKVFPGNKEISVDMDSSVYYPADSPSDFRIIVSVNVSSDSYFDISLVAVAQFTIDRRLKPEIQKHLINLNSPAIVFPYIRSYISTLTANSGKAVNAVIIPTQFFKGELTEVDECPLID